MSQRRFESTAALACLLAFLVIAAAPAPAGAQVSNPTVEMTQTRVGAAAFSFGASIGQVAGTAWERVYAPQARDFKISELQWDLEDVAVAGVQAAAAVGRFRLNFGYWAAVNEGDGDMVDRDWAVFDSESDDDWSHESRHPDTDLDSGSVLDLNLDLQAYARGSFSLSGILGYRRSEWEWSARGGSYTYSWDVNDDGYLTEDEWRADRGSFPADELLITYRQTYDVPYFGFGCEGTLGFVQVRGHLLYSPWVSAEDDDRHFRGSRRWEGDFSGGSWLGAGVFARWFFLPQWYATLGVEYEKYAEIVGDVTYTTPEGQWRYGDAGSVEMETLMLLAGAGFRF